MWHIQCIHPQLQTPEDISDYIFCTNSFIRHLWKSSGQVAPTPPQLQVDAVENSVVTHRGASIDAVRVCSYFNQRPRAQLTSPLSQLRFKLPPKYQGNNDEFLSAIRYFCERIFKLKAEGALYCRISLMSPRSLIGIAPLSHWFRFYWTKGFLETFIRRRVSLFNELADGEFFWSWYE